MKLDQIDTAINATHKKNTTHKIFVMVEIWRIIIILAVDVDCD